MAPPELGKCSVVLLTFGQRSFRKEWIECLRSVKCLVPAPLLRHEIGRSQRIAVGYGKGDKAGLRIKVAQYRAS